MKKIPAIKRHILLLPLLALNLGSFAQNPELKEKKTLLNDDMKLIYHINGNNVKEGSYYVKNLKSDGLILKGSYTNNKRSGNWYFYNEAGKPETVYNYNQNKLAYIDSSLISKITINIPDQKKDVVENTKIPILLSPMRLFLSEMSNNISVPSEHFTYNVPLPIQIKTVIDIDGSPKYYVTYNYKEKTIEQELKLKTSSFDIEWIPAIYNKTPVKSEYIINTEINSSSDKGDGYRRFRWN